MVLNTIAVLFQPVQKAMTQSHDTKIQNLYVDCNDAGGNKLMNKKDKQKSLFVLFKYIPNRIWCYFLISS